MAPFIAGYEAGETPNPCVGCNGHVRLDAMLELATRLGAGRLATGHYARVATDGSDGDGNGDTAPLLRVPADAAKDQTYMLAALSSESLARMSFPLGELTKPEVRRLAAKAGLPVASKADSQDLCFLAGTTRARFLERHAGIADRPGEVVDRDGTVLGTHSGHQRFTVGQRRGLGIANGEPLFVLAKDAARNRVVVGPQAALQADRVRVRAARDCTGRALASTGSSSATAPSRWARASRERWTRGCTSRSRWSSTNQSTAPRPASSPV